MNALTAYLLKSSCWLPLDKSVYGNNWPTHFKKRIPGPRNAQDTFKNAGKRLPWRPLSQQAISDYFSLQPEATTRSECPRVPAPQGLNAPSISHEGQKEPPRQEAEGHLGVWWPYRLQRSPKETGVGRIMQPPSRLQLLHLHGVLGEKLRNVVSNTLKTKVEERMLGRWQRKAPGLCLPTETTSARAQSIGQNCSGTRESLPGERMGGKCG